MATIIEELVSRLGFDIDDKKLTAFNKKSEQLKNTLKKISVVASAAAVGITAWVSKIAIATDANVKFADSIGISFLALQELQFATEREGGSIQSLKSSLLALSQRAGEAFRGMGEGVEIFGLLGVEIRNTNGELKTADVLLGDIANQFQGFGKTQQIEFANKLGISPELLLLMQKGRRNLDELRAKAKSFGLVSEQTARRSERFQDSLTDLRSTVRAIFTNIAGDLLPTVMELGDQLREWFLMNKELIKQNVSKAVDLLTIATKFLVKNVKVLLILIGSIVALKIAAFLGTFVLAIGTAITAISGLNASLTITNVLMGGLPLLIGLTIAALIALVLIWDDLTNAQKKDGKESFFGNLAKRSEGARKKVELFIIAFKALTAPLRLNWKLMKLFIAAIKKLFGTLTSIGDRLGDALVNRIEAINTAIENAIAGYQKLKGMFGGSDGPNIINKDGQFVIPGPADPSSLSSNSTTINAEINIQSASGNPESIGVAVQTALNNMVRNGLENNPSIVVA